MGNRNPSPVSVKFKLVQIKRNKLIKLKIMKQI